MSHEGVGSKTPPSAPIHPWNWPSQPRKRIHIDHFEFEKGVYLIVTDSHSKWIEVDDSVDDNRNSAGFVFFVFGLPETIVSDNGPRELSAESSKSLQTANGLRHIVSSPYHPASN